MDGIAPGPIKDTPGVSKLKPKEISSSTYEKMPLFKLGYKWDVVMAAVCLACIRCGLVLTTGETVVIFRLVLVIHDTMSNFVFSFSFFV